MQAIKRRNFLALLAAPLVARFAPKSNAISYREGGHTFYEFDFSRPELNLSMDEFRLRYMEPAIKALIDKFDWTVPADMQFRGTRRRLTAEQRRFHADRLPT